MTGFHQNVGPAGTFPGPRGSSEVHLHQDFQPATQNVDKQVEVGRWDAGERIREQMKELRRS